MKKIPTLFVRTRTDEPAALGAPAGQVRDEVTPGCEWVMAGEGVATLKYDGSCVKVEGGKIFKRYELKSGNVTPVGFVPAQEPDDTTGDQPGWLPADFNNPADQWLQEAVINWGKAKGLLPDGTYELVGPKVNGNAEGRPIHVLIPHGKMVLHQLPLDFNGLKHYLGTHAIEGIVWHHPDGRMCKLKGRDFGFKRVKAMSPEENPSAANRRLKVMFVTPQVFVNMAATGAAWKVSGDGLPADAKATGAGYDPHKAQFWLHIESASFPELPEDGQLEVLPAIKFENLMVME